jgi:FkbM family methyltransferase
VGPPPVRPVAALRALDKVASTALYADYMVALWRDARALKTAQPLTHFHGQLPPLSEPDKRRLVEILQRKPVFMTVRNGDAALRLPYTGLNPVIEREQARGQFFEHEELEFLAGRLPPGLRIIDAGANTGNHTLFFASVMQARTVVPIEPEARAAAAIRSIVAENRLRNVDLSCLGKAVGAEAGRLTPVYSEGGGLGATRFLPDPEGEVTIEQLDALVPGPVDFLKIDVEGMEMEVLAGASRLIAGNRPALFVEVLDAAIPVFLAWADANSYRIEKLFPDKSHCNYFLVPAV